MSKIGEGEGGGVKQFLSKHSPPSPGLVHGPLPTIIPLPCSPGGHEDMGNASLPHGVSSPAPPLRCGEDEGGGAGGMGPSLFLTVPAFYQSIRDPPTYSRAEDRQTDRGTGGAVTAASCGGNRTIQRSIKDFRYKVKINLSFWNNLK